MRQAMFEWMILPFVLWGTFQGVLYYHKAQVEMALNLAVFEGQMEASLQGRYTQDIYDEMRGYLVSVHRYDPSLIEITGTETLTLRGNYLDVTIRVPRTRLSVIPMFENASMGDFYVVEKRIMSEYRP